MFKKILSNTAYQIIWKVLTALISIILLNLLTNYLPINLFGEYWKVYNYLLVFAFLADLGLYTISIREINKDKKNAAKIIWNILSLRLVLWVCVILLALAIALMMPAYNSQLSLIAIFIVGIFTLFWLINSSILALMQSYLKMQFSLFSAVFWKLINLWCIAGIIFIFFPKHQDLDYFYPFLFIIWAGLIWNIVTTIWNYIYARKITNIQFLWDGPYIYKIFKSSIPYWIAIFLGVVYMKVDIILLSILESPEKSSVSIALYSVPMKIMEVFMLTGTFFLNSLLPGLSQGFQKKETQKIISLLRASYLFLLLWSVIMFVFAYVFKDNMIEIVANKDYLNRELYQYTSSDAFIIVLLMIVFYSLFLVFQYIFIAAERQSDLLKINLSITIFNIIWNILLIPKYSFLGAGIVTVFSQFLLLILAFFYSRKIIKFSLPKKESLGIIILWFLLYIVLHFFHTSLLSQ